MSHISAITGLSGLIFPDIFIGGGGEEIPSLDFSEDFDSMYISLF